jgi:hypothetical protein
MMPTKQEREPPNEAEQTKHAAVSARIGEQVIHTLGKPVDLLLVQVRKLWDNHYRVNVLVGADAVTFKIANSYFVEGDNDGVIVKSTPKIAKLY